MSLNTDQQPNYSASLSAARRHESGARWTEAARAYLNALVTHQELEEVTLSGLERCARRAQRAFSQSGKTELETSGDSRHDHAQRLVASIDLQSLDEQSMTLPSILLAAGYSLCGRWSDSLRVLGPLTSTPQLLSPSLLRRWPQLVTRLHEEYPSETSTQTFDSKRSLSSRTSWIALLATLDVVAQRGYVHEGMMMCQHALHHISEPLHQALIYYEAGRIGVNHQRFASGALALRAALRLTPSLRDEVADVLDATLYAQLAFDERLDDLISLRCEELPTELIDSWVFEMTSSVTTRRVEFAIWLGERMELLSPIIEGKLNVKGVAMRSAAFHCYALALNEAPVNSEPHHEAFQKLTKLTLIRLGAPEYELEDDEPTIDTDDERLSKVNRASLSQELVEAAESRLLMQLKDLQHFALIERFLEYKAAAHHLSKYERAQAFNALAHIAFSARHDLKGAVEYAWCGAQLSPQELKIGSFIKEAQRVDDWDSLERLLRIQLKLSRDHKKRKTILRALSHGYRRARQWLDGYETLIEVGCEEALAQLTLTPGEIDAPNSLILSDKVEREIASLLRVKGAALAIGNEFILAGQWSDLLRLIERLQSRGKVAASLLVHGVNQSPQAWLFAQPLLELYAQEERWGKWVDLVLTAPRDSWSIKEWGPLINDAISRSKDWAPELRTRLLKARAEWLGEEGASAESQLEAWRVYLTEHPADLSALEMFEERAELLAAWDEVASAYERAIPLRKTGKVRILAHLAELYEQRLDSREEAARCWKKILEISPHHEEAGSWLTLHHAQKQDWYHVLLVCALWTPKNEQHPVWIESKVRGHLGLGELEDAYFWWGLLAEKKSQMLFVHTLLRLAADRRSGELTLRLIHLIEQEFAYSSPTHGSTEDSPSDSVSESSNGDIFGSTIGEADSTLGEPSELSAHLPSSEDLLRVKARAFAWITPRDELSAIECWEQLRVLHPEDREAISALTRLYISTNKRASLIKHLSLIEGDQEIVLTHREMIIEGALILETRFQEYTEAFKCWLALYEHSRIDRDRCISAFERLVTLDPELVQLLQELYKILAEHTTSKVMKIEHLLAISRISVESPQHWVTSYSALCQALELGGRNVSRVVRLLVERTVPLGTWEKTAQILSSVPTWHAQAFAAEIMETRLGAHHQALALYREALKLYPHQSSEMRPHHLKRQQTLRTSLNRLTRRFNPPPLPGPTMAPRKAPIFNPARLPPPRES